MNQQEREKLVEYIDMCHDSPVALSPTNVKCLYPANDAVESLRAKAPFDIALGSLGFIWKEFAVVRHLA